jgi:hypothetical protein
MLYSVIFRKYSAKNLYQGSLVIGYNLVPSKKFLIPRGKMKETVSV